MNAFFTSHFSYCPLIWVCHGRSNNRKRNMLHESCPRIIYNDQQLSFTNYWITTVLSQFKLEMFRFCNWFIINKIRAENPYNLRHVSAFSRPIVKNVYHGTESISYLAPNIWDIQPEKLKNIKNQEKKEKRELKQKEE